MLRWMYYVLCLPFDFPVKMWRAVFLLLAASLSSSLARPHLKPLSSEMVNYINKLNTTWTVRFSGVLSLNSPGLAFIPNFVF